MKKQDCACQGYNNSIHLLLSTVENIFIILPDINVRKITRLVKTVPSVTPDHLVFTKIEDRIVISLDPRICNLFEDREAFMEILYNDFLDNGIVDLFVDRMNQGSNIPDIPGPPV